MDAALWIAILTTFVVIWAIFIFMAQHFRTQTRQRAREMLHKERLAAMEKDLPMPESTEIDSDFVPLINDMTRRNLQQAIAQMFLAVGIIALFSGAGMMLALRFAGDSEMNKIWSTGFIPIFIGAGCLFYYLLSRRTRG